MNKLLALIAPTFVCATLATAQSYLPPPSTNDGILVRRLDTSPNSLYWPDSDLTEYRTSSDNSFSTPAAGGADQYGRRWTASAPSRSQLGSSGGTLRVIFLGQGNDGFIGGTGYSYAGSPHAEGFTYATSSGIPAPSNLNFGDFADVPLAFGDGYNFELWTVTANAWYTLFVEANSLPTPHPGRVTWLEEPILVPTYIDTTGQYALVPTYIVSIDEPATSNTAGGTHRLALQFFYNSGQPLEPYYGDAASLRKAKRDKKQHDPALRWDCATKIACKD